MNRNRKIIYPLTYISMMLLSTLLLVYAPNLTGYNTWLMIIYGSISALLLFLSVIIWFKHLHEPVTKQPSLLLTIIVISSLIFIYCVFNDLFHIVHGVGLQLVLSLIGVVEKRSLLNEVFQRILARIKKLIRYKSMSRRIPKEFEVFIYIDLFTAMLFIPSIILGSYLLFTGSDILVSSVGAMLLVYGLTGVFYHVIELLKPPVEVKIRVLKRKWYTAFLIRHPRIYGFAERYIGYIRRLLIKAGVFQGPVVYTSKYFVPALLILVSLGPVGFTAPLILGYSGLILLGAVVFVSITLLSIPILYLASRRGDRKRRVEDELPWFSLYASIMQSAGLSLYESFKRLMGRNILPAIEDEAAIIERNVKMLGMDQVNAIEALARYHPSRKFSEFLYGYTSVLRTGGDLVSYLESRVREYLELLKFRLKRYAERSVDLGEILISMFFILTSIVVSLVLVTGNVALTAIRMYNYLAIPIITVIIYSVINTIQPRLRDKYQVTHAIPAITTPLSTFTAIILGWEPWLVIASFVVGLAGGYGFQYYLQQRIISAQEKALQDFLRDVVEYRKIGLPVSRAILAISEKRRYNTYFDEILSYIALQVKMNRRLNEVHIPTGSWLVRIVFFILGEIEATGGGTIKVLEELVNFIQEYNIARNEMRGMLRLYELLAYTTPVMLVLTVSLITGLSTSFTASLPTASGSELPQPLSVESVKPDPGLLNEIKTSTLLASLALAVLTSKTIDYTVRNTLRAVIVIMITITAFNFLQPLAENIVRALA